MRRSKLEHYLHAVWATKQRQSLITDDLRAPIYACIEAEAKRLRCPILALNGMPDHVHLIVRLPSIVCVSQLLKQVKGLSSACANDLTDNQQFFRWQEGYAAYSLCHPVLDKVIAYVQNQERHHTLGPLWPSLEEVDEEVDEEVEKLGG